MYKKLNYLIQVDAPFKEREDRVAIRDYLFRKGAMVNRDIEFRKSLRKGSRYKSIDKKVINKGSLQELQKIADNIYEEEIFTREAQNKETMTQKYGGYQSNPVTKNIVITNETKKDELSR